VDPTVGVNGIISCAEVNDGANKDGRAAYDQAHNLKLLGAYVRTFGRFNVAAGLGGQLVTGLPYTKSRTVNVLIPGTTTNAGPTATYFYEERGSDTLPTLYQLDASLETTFTVWQTLELGVKGEVFNFTDVQKARAVSNTTWCNDFSATASASCTASRAIYGTSTARGSFQPPRNFRLTALLRF
jgi:hypothetical protein